MRAKNLIIILLPFLIIIMSANVLGACGACNYYTLDCKSCYDGTYSISCDCTSPPCSPGCEDIWNGAGFCEEVWTDCSPGVCRSNACCDPQCGTNDCGPDPICGTSCGTCPFNKPDCVSGTCTCVPDCSGKDCDTDGCGGTCGSYGGGCPSDQICSSGVCVSDCNPATIGDYKCFGDTIYQCDGNGWNTYIKNCPPPQYQCFDHSSICGIICTSQCGVTKWCGQYDSCTGYCTECANPNEVCYYSGSVGKCKKDCSGQPCSTGPLCCSTSIPPYPLSEGSQTTQQLDAYTPPGCHVSCYESYEPFQQSTCGINQRCYKWNVYINREVLDCGVKVCFDCVNDPSCCVEGMTGTDPECKTCNANWYETGGHCCLPGRFWDGVACRQRNPCYSSLVQSGYCLFRAPNCIYSPQTSSWLPETSNCNLISSNKGCCFIGEGLYGITSPFDMTYGMYYYWHELVPNVIY
jgi:hypothetical protein